MTQLEQAQAAVVQAEEALPAHEQQARQLRQEHAQLVEQGPRGLGDVPAHAEQLEILNAEIGACNAAIRLACAQLQEANRLVGKEEQAIGLARSTIVSLQHAVTESDRLAAQAREQVALWEGQGRQKQIELAAAWAMLAELLGV